jgi:UPF0755 protein
MQVESKRVIFIPKGSTSSIITYLNKNAYSVNGLDKLIVNAYGYPQSGWIDLKAKHMSKYDFLYKLTRSKAAVRTVTLIPGETYYFFLKSIVARLNVNEEELFEAYHRLKYKKDGNILSQTYSLPIGMKANDIIKYLFKYTDDQYQKYSKKIFGTYDQEQWYKYITIASIIQKESASKEEMTTVSSVIYNRLNKKMRLQMDGTLNYAQYSHVRVTPKMIREDKSSYNTYKTKGIPSDPVSAIEFEAIKAAIFPLKTDYLYFMKSIKGTEHMFSKSLKSHRAAINKVKKHQRAQRKKSAKKVLKKKIIDTKKQSQKTTKQLWQTVK